MKFKVQVAYDSDDHERTWWEEFEKYITDPELWAQETIEYFNNTLRPGELPRKVLAVEIIEDENNEQLHDWLKRTDGMSAIVNGRVCDLMRCAKCGITGKRYGLKSNVKIDSKYKKKAFSRCDTARAELARNPR